jgi:hypothetical protein
MSYQEKENIVNIISALLITSVYAFIVYQRHLQGSINLTEDFRQWGIVFLIFIGVSIVARILIYIIFHIINAITTQEEDIPINDERTKLIKLKGTRNSHYAFNICFASAFVALAIGMPVYGIFIGFIVSCVISEIVDNSSQLYYYRKGF